MECRQPSLEGTGEITLRRLIKESLRMRPDRLVVGEVREAESLDLLIALNSGLPGMCSIHANSARAAMYARFGAANIGLIHLNGTGQAVAVRTRHYPAELVQHRPGRLVAAELKRLFELHCAYAVLLTGHIPGGGEPAGQRCARLVEDGARGHGGLAPTRAAH